ncbi:hypothetical protein H0O01_05135 [Candidatus Micrarchaeota archaeon]|nr:hypothetical protein [Candidatus Micrarchaeota archaeon]
MNENTRVLKAIIRSEKKAGYLEARKIAKEMHRKLPPNPLIDDYLVRPNNYQAGAKRSNEWMRVPSNLWADELVAHPCKDGVFQKGVDLVDSSTGWILPASNIPPEICGILGMGLFLVPEDVTNESGKTIVHPKTVIVITPMIQVSEWGKVEEVTRIPTFVTSEEFKLVKSPEKRILRRVDGIGIRPINRGYGMQDEYYGWGKRDIHINCDPDWHMEVATVE